MHLIQFRVRVWIARLGQGGAAREARARVLFRGWVPSYLRLGPHFIVALPLFEQARAALGLGYL